MFKEPLSLLSTSPAARQAAPLSTCWTHVTQTDDVETEETPPLAFIFPHLVIVTSPAARA